MWCICHQNFQTIFMSVMYLSSLIENQITKKNSKVVGVQGRGPQGSTIGIQGGGPLESKFGKL